MQGILQGSICFTGIGSHVADILVQFLLWSLHTGWVCAWREPAQILTLGKLHSELVQCGESRIQVLCVETNAYLKKKSNLVVFDASAVACCKDRLCTKLASMGPLFLASLYPVLLQRSCKSQEHLIGPGFKQILHPRGWSLDDSTQVVHFSFLHLNTIFYLQSSSSSSPDGKPACLANITFNLLVCCIPAITSSCQ